MSYLEISCGLEYTNFFDLKICLLEALEAFYGFIVVPIVDPSFQRSSGESVNDFTISDITLLSDDWSRVVGTLSHYLDLDSESPFVRQYHEDYLNEELTFSQGLGLPAVMLFLHSSRVNNLSRILLSYLEKSNFTNIWAFVPMLCQRTLRAQESEGNANTEVWDEPWRWWSTFHERTNWHKRVGVVLELPAILPPKEILNRWLGEPIRAIAIPTSLFHSNWKGYPVLPKAHQKVVVQMIEQRAEVIVTGNRCSNIENYVQYLYELWKKRPLNVGDPMRGFAKGWEDLLIIPLQPLANNLDSRTYYDFEADPVKYTKYQKAITQAFKDIQIKGKKDLSTLLAHASISVDTNVINQDDNAIQKDNNTVTVMVLGAGRGPLVLATFFAADATNTKVKVIAVEKNPCAVVTLTRKAKVCWADRDLTIISGDMRKINLALKADIIVSEMLGSWGDNELSPECLDGAAGLLKSNGISIPCRYSSYVAPISSARLWSQLADPDKNVMEKNLETLWVVYMKNKCDLGEIKPVFTFEHPAKGVIDSKGKEKLDDRGVPVTDNRRSTVLKWVVNEDNVLHGFAGYFDSLLYGEEMISIVPSTHTLELISWYPIYIPIKTPLRIQKGETITATFWRCTNHRKVWYEWIVQVGGHSTPLHNQNGRSYDMSLGLH